jgi:hypothetical protein
MQTAPAVDDLVGITELAGRWSTSAFDEERVRPAAKLEIGFFHGRDAIPSRPWTMTCSTATPS